MTTVKSTVLLKKGMKSPTVKQLQVKLNAWIRIIHGTSGATLVEDGIFGDATERLVKFFQCHHFLLIDGIAGPQTMDVLNRGVAALPTLKIGSQGDIVKRLQQVLAAYGISVGAIDGQYGVKTRAAVMRFQNDYHLFDSKGQATGEVTLNTWAHLIKEPAYMACGPLGSFS